MSNKYAQNINFQQRKLDNSNSQRKYYLQKEEQEGEKLNAVNSELSIDSNTPNKILKRPVMRKGSHPQQGIRRYNSILKQSGMKEENIKKVNQSIQENRYSQHKIIYDNTNNSQDQLIMDGIQILEIKHYNEVPTSKNVSSQTKEADPRFPILKADRSNNKPSNVLPERRISTYEKGSNHINKKKISIEDKDQYILNFANKKEPKQIFSSNKDRRLSVEKSRNRFLSVEEQVEIAQKNGMFQLMKETLRLKNQVKQIESKKDIKEIAMREDEEEKKRLEEQITVISEMQEKWTALAAKKLQLFKSEQYPIHFSSKNNSIPTENIPPPTQEQQIVKKFIKIPPLTHHLIDESACSSLNQSFDKQTTNSNIKIWNEKGQIDGRVRANYSISKQDKIERERDHQKGSLSVERQKIQNSSPLKQQQQQYHHHYLQTQDPLPTNSMLNLYKQKTIVPEYDSNLTEPSYSNLHQQLQNSPNADLEGILALSNAITPNTKIDCIVDHYAQYSSSKNNSPIRSQLELSINKTINKNQPLQQNQGEAIPQQYIRYFDYSTNFENSTPYKQRQISHSKKYKSIDCSRNSLVSSFQFQPSNLQNHRQDCKFPSLNHTNKTDKSQSDSSNFHLTNISQIKQFKFQKMN